MVKPDWCPQDVWNSACDAKAQGGGLPVVETIARAILAEREACAQIIANYELEADASAPTDYSDGYNAAVCEFAVFGSQAILGRGK